ncbi:alpha-D-ribose 1-methylphosphonate 5-triphosphate synthase subunit PhnG [mine drainage metagenome]|uniref:Alpha-D-ribose 1-methylphosphonate 5-triphosphate synthase subunit PhnG n=1 Tax=mine drainage metagenome TaxID=410659 RepID=A0A1J5Q0S9_9ZZZZ
MGEDLNRRGWMGLLAKARPEALAALWNEAVPHEVLRGPEVGSVMVQGRIGGTGAPFNLGEITVTRCTLRLASGEVGMAHVQGRDKAHARRAALLDALLQGPRGAALQVAVLAPLAEAMAEAKHVRAAKAAATRVEFFTLVRGED